MAAAGSGGWTPTPQHLQEICGLLAIALNPMDPRYAVAAQTVEQQMLEPNFVVCDPDPPRPGPLAPTLTPNPTRPDPTRPSPNPNPIGPNTPLPWTVSVNPNEVTRTNPP